MRDSNVTTSGTPTTDSMTGETQGWEGRTTRLSVVGSARQNSRTGIDAFRRSQADQAIARIEEAYRRGLAIPDIR